MAIDGTIGLISVAFSFWILIPDTGKTGTMLAA
jgi:hypothetical protein